MQPMGRKEMNQCIMNMLRFRKEHNKRSSGRRRIKLSKVAKNALQKGSVEKYFWLGFDSRHEDLSRKRKNTTSSRRAIALEELAAELIANGIMREAQQISPGEWHGVIDTSRVFNIDETPQAIHFGENGSPEIAYCPRGEVCTELVKENREFVTVTPVISLGGLLCACQVIFAAKGITSDMAPESIVENIPNFCNSTLLDRLMRNT